MSHDTECLLVWEVVYADALTQQWRGSLEDIHVSLQKSVHVKFAQELFKEADE